MANLFSFRSASVPESVHVVGFRGREAISEIYRFDVGLLLKDGAELSLEEVIGAAATLEIAHGDDPPLKYCGFLSRCELVHAWEGQLLYRAVLVPHLWQAGLSRHGRVFVDQPIGDVIEKLLAEAGVPEHALELHGQHEPYPQICQYKESDLAFLSRWMEREGIYYYFDHEGDTEKLVMTDDVGAHGPPTGDPIRYVPASGEDDHMSLVALDMFLCTHAVVPGSVELLDWDYLNPGLRNFGEAPVTGGSGSSGGSPGVERWHGQNHLTPAAGKRLATIRAEELLAARVVYRGEGRVFGLRPGYRFELNEHPQASLNAEYLATSVDHYGNQSARDPIVKKLLGLDKDDEYRVQLTAIRSNVQYRAPRRTPWPRIYGLERGSVDGPADSDYAQLDEHGRYRVKIHFDEEESPAGESSTWVRMAQPHGGNPEGMHFPLRKETEVLIAFIGGDPDRPVITAAAPNAVQPSPVTKDNQTQNVIHTGGDNRIEMEDQAGKQYVDISTPPQQTFIHLGEPHGSHGGYIHFHTGGNQLITIGGNRDITVGGSKTMEIAGSFDTEVGGNITLEGGASYAVEIAANISFENGGNYDVESGGNQAFECGGNFDVESGGNIAFENPGNFDAESGGNQAFECGGDFDVEAGGNVAFEAGGNIDGEAGGNISWEAGGNFNVECGGAINLESGGPLNGDIGGGVIINAPTVTLTCGKFEAGDGSWLDITGFKAEIVGISLGATGLKVEAVGFKLETQGANLAKIGAALRSGGLKAAGRGLISELAGLITLA